MALLASMILRFDKIEIRFSNMGQIPNSLISRYDMI